jgi:UDP-N-acetylglucosamine 2-epimerase (non-hydrolysing)
MVDVAHAPAINIATRSTSRRDRRPRTHPSRPAERSTFKILVVFGTRPEAIKLAPVIRGLSRSPWAEVVVGATGQHRELLDQTLNAFGIVPDFDLGVMRTSQDLSETTAAILNGMAPVLRTHQPAAVIVQGDTTTSLAGALSAYHQRIPVAHVEAGLRTHTACEPFPEEVYRQMVSRLATWHFAPTTRARDNLLLEGVAADSIFVTGNTIVDALQDIRTRVIDAAAPDVELPACRGRQRLLLVTSHRRENFGEGLHNICAALRTLADRNRELLIVYPVHPNPAVQAPVREMLGRHERIHLIAPLDYFAFIKLMQRAHLILTDSGGIQEEGPSFGIPVIVTRRITERPEGVDAGFARTVGTDGDAIVANVERWLRDETVRARLRRAQNPYGDGRAAERIVAHLGRLLGAVGPEASSSVNA